MTFQDAKRHLGVEEPENRTRRAVERTAASGLLLRSLIVWWHETACAQPGQPIRNWKNKSRGSFADILGELRQQTLQTQSETN